MGQNYPDQPSPFIKKEETIKNPLEVFSQYSAIKPDTVINSTSDGAERNWARKAAFTQLNMALENYKDSIQLGELTRNKIRDYQSKIAALADKELTEKGDIELALEVLEFLGIDISRQREELKSWD